MKVQVLRNLGSGLPAYTEGQIVDSSDGQMLVERGLAVAIDEPKPIEAVAQKPAIAEAKRPVVPAKESKTNTEPAERSPAITISSKGK
jgi:hypothetical protein